MFDDAAVLSSAEQIEKFSVVREQNEKFPLVDDFAGRLAARLGVPLVPALRKVRPTQPQKDFTNATQKAENIKGAFECAAPVQGKTLLVVDDVYDSGATLKEAGRILKQAGAGRLYAFCIARTRHRGDL